MKAVAARDPARAAEVLTKAFLRAGRLLEVPQRVLARIVGTSEASMSRLGARRQVAPDTKEGELALLFVRLYRSLDTLFGGNVEQSRAWFHAENRHLGGRPLDLAQTAVGLVHVTEYLDAMRGKL